MTSTITQEKVCQSVQPDHGSPCICLEHAEGDHRDEHGCTWPNTRAAELTDAEARYGLCTRDPSHGPAEVPWAGQRLCWDCADADLDRLAEALKDEPVQVGGFGLGNIPHLEPRTPTQDELAERLAADLLTLADNSLKRVDRIMELLTREETWDGVTV